MVAKLQQASAEYSAVDSMAQDPEFWVADFDDYARIQMLEAVDNDFATLPADTKQDVYNGIKKQHEPNIWNTTINPAMGAVGDFAQNKVLPLVGEAALETAAPFASALKGASAGYLDFTDPINEQINAFEEQQGVLEPYRRKNDIINQIGDTALEFGGALAPISAAEKAAAGVIKGAGMLPKMLRGSAAFGAYEGLRKPHEGESRLGNAAMGAGLGAALPMAGSALQRVLRKPMPRPIGLGSERAAMAAQQATQQARYDQTKNLMHLYAKAMQESQAARPEALAKNPVFQSKAQGALVELEKLASDIQNKVINPDLVHELEVTQLAKYIKGLREFVATGKSQPQKVNSVKQFVGRVRKNVQKRTEAVKPKPEPVKVEPKTTTESKPRQTPLKGSIQEQVAKTAKAANLPENAGTMTGKPLEKELGRKLTPDEKDIHQNLRSIATTEEVDAAAGIHKQKPVNKAELKYEAVADSISDKFKPLAEKVDEAMQQGKALRVEYIAEQAGRSNEAAKITKSGNVKVEVTDFTPLHWIKRGDKTMLGGYNQRGHFVNYYLEPSEKGSQLLKAGKIVDRPFVGEYPNVYKGQQTFNVSDVLGRGVRSVEGAVKTSEAMANAQAMAEVVKPEFMKSLSEPVQRIIRNVNKKGQFTPAEIKMIQKELKKDIEELKKFCNLFGMK